MSTLRNAKKRTDSTLIEPLNGSNRASQVNSDAGAHLKLRQGDKESFANAKIFSRRRELDPVSTSSYRSAIDALNKGGAQGLLDYLQDNDRTIFDPLYELVREVLQREEEWAIWTSPDEVREREKPMSRERKRKRVTRTGSSPARAH